MGEPQDPVHAGNGVPTVTKYIDAGRMHFPLKLQPAVVNGRLA